MPRSFLVKQQIEMCSENCKEDSPQSEGCPLGSPGQLQGAPEQSTDRYAMLDTKQNELSCTLKPENDYYKRLKESSEMTKEMGAHVSWLRENPLSEAQEVSFFNVVTSDGKERTKDTINFFVPSGGLRAEIGLTNQLPDGLPHLIKYRSGALWEANADAMISNVPLTCLGRYNHTIVNAATTCSKPIKGTFSHLSTQSPMYSGYCLKNSLSPHSTRHETNHCFEGNAAVSSYPLLPTKIQNSVFKVPKKPQIEQYSMAAPASQGLLVYQDSDVSAFKPYVRRNDRFINERFRLNETIHEVPVGSKSFSDNVNSSNCAVPHLNHVSTTWYNAKIEVDTEKVTEQTSSSSSHDARPASCPQKDAVATESPDEWMVPEAPQPKPVKSNRKYPCDVCGRSFSRSSTLTTHRRIHSGEKPFVCQLCGRAFRQPGNLSRHRLTHTTAKPYVCVHCNKAFNRASNLHTHMRTHTDYKPFACEFCGKRFHQKVDMKIHRYTHTGEKPHKCQKCGRGFKQLTHLTYHMRTHSEERMYHCPYCGKGFNQKGNMQAHIYRHTGERPFKCDTCGKGFTLASTLNTHKRTHAANKPFQCEFCDKAFYQRNGLKTHYIASHPFSAGMSLL